MQKQKNNKLCNSLVANYVYNYLLLLGKNQKSLEMKKIYQQNTFLKLSLNIYVYTLENYFIIKFRMLKYVIQNKEDKGCVIEKKTNLFLITFIHRSHLRTMSDTVHDILYL